MKTQENSIQPLLQELRDRRWSDAAIGKQLGTAPATIWRWRHGRQPDAALAIIIALESLLAHP